MISVFKTSVETKAQVEQLKPHFDKLLLKGRWSFDLEDCDRVLRVDCENDLVLAIVDLLKTHQFNCEALE